MDRIVTIRIQKDEIILRRKEVARALLLHSTGIKSGMVSSLSVEDLTLLFWLYDRIFFNNGFAEGFAGKLKFSISRRMTKSAGITLCPRRIDRIKPEELVIEIRIGVDFFLQYGMLDGSKFVCGIKTENSLEALLLVFEHELCHAVEFITFKKSSCKGKRFKTIAGNIFGHTESYHKLPTNRQIASQKLGLKLGDTVSFDFEGKRLTGILYNINKRATVMVRDRKGQLADKHGNRYSKYYVPLPGLG